MPQNKNTATKVGNKLENNNPPVSSEYITFEPTRKNVIHAKTTASNRKINQPILTLNALCNNPSGFNFIF